MKSTVVAALFLSCVLPGSSGQQAPASSQKAPDAAPGKTASSPAPVQLFFAVNDKKGHPAVDAQLAKEELQVLDDGTPVEEILELRRAENVPIRYALVLDLSGSARGTIEFSLAAVEFLRKTVRPGVDFAEVVAFRADVSPAMAFQPDELSTQLRKAALKGGTALYDGLWFACEDLAVAKSDRERRVILLVSDGDDNQSRHTLEEVKQAALRAGVTVFTIGTQGPSRLAFHSFSEKLGKLPETTGGRTLQPESGTEAARELAEIEAHMRSQYVLVYRLTEAASEGKLRIVKIAVAKDRELRIQAPSGYYLPQPQPRQGSATPGPPLRVRVSADVSQAFLTHKVNPQYPEEAKLGRIQGAVVLRVLIGKDGKVMKVDVVSGHPLFIPNSVSAVKEWRYRPYLLNGEPVEVETQVTINFTLTG